MTGRDVVDPFWTSYLQIVPLPGVALQEKASGTAPSASRPGRRVGVETAPIVAGMLAVVN